MVRGANVEGITIGRFVEQGELIQNGKEGREAIVGSSSSDTILVKATEKEHGYKEKEGSREN